MVKKLALILVVFLVGCSTYQLKRLDQILGAFTMRICGTRNQEEVFQECLKRRISERKRAS